MSGHSKRLQAVLLAVTPLVFGWAAPAWAAPDKGDTAFLMVSTVLVLLMTIPGLALFYCGLVRTKNALATLMQVFATVCLVCLIWMLYGYSLAFTADERTTPFVGGLSKAFLAGITPDSVAATFSPGVYVPEYAYIWFQMTFAAITPALIVGAFAERMRFSALLLFMVLWVTIVYCPIAHMVWYWAGPDALIDAARAVSGTTGEARAVAEAKLQGLLGSAGLAAQWGALDFAGGTVVHINAGIAGLVGALMLGPRSGYGREPMPPHSLTLSMVGAALLWVGWFGFNCGSNLEANGTAALAMGNTFGATAMAALAWVFAEWVLKGKPTTLGLISGVVVGLVAVTPASGFAGPMGSIVLGFVAGIFGFVACTSLKSALGYDDSLDVFGVHCVGGIVGAIGTGILVNPHFGGTGVVDYISQPGQITVTYDMATQMKAQLKAVALTLVWSGVFSAIIYKFVDLVIGLRLPREKERAGLDVTEHGERGYYF
ncbi:ammonium transporter [Hyphomicrobium sp. LHD-15]|uniref:ammonium transporter n=1 Tax=Hyphomicrobium sp. LHD-15 TaxID=3072142 RepID=UPI00280EAEAD|nr:ammonium transporter [Hyphomicrobium sp. LHD-15]MDQ8699564.1 ammonium transporter [Hyphomicrobium sp. LHD-15]